MSLVGASHRLGDSLLNVVQESIVHQGRLSDVLDVIFPNQRKINESRRSTGLRDPGTRNVLELDIWFPDLHICFEFQDSYHYEPTWYFQFSLQKIQQRDEQVQTRGMTLVVVPCWWDGQQQSLVASIRFHRPDLLLSAFTEGHHLISLNPPLSQFISEDIPDVGTLMLASFPVATNVFSTTDFWWLGEKYDGMRCCWNPSRRALSGKKISLRSSFSHHLPPTFIDSECWFGRGEYQQIMRVVNGCNDDNGENSSDAGPHWHQFRLVAFDDPDPATRSLEFERRYQHLLCNVTYHNPFVVVVSRILCNDENKMKLIVNKIIEGGGEGGILRLPLSPFLPGRSPFLLKLKAARSDEEALVVGEGENKSIRLKLPNGQTFLVACENVPKKTTPKVGDVVTFCYDSFSRQALPVNPKITRIRLDLSWDDFALRLGDTNLKGFVSKPLGYWTHNNMRLLFESIATSRSLDPLLPETWYSIPCKVIKKTMGVATILNKIKGSYYKKLQFLFPDVKLDPLKISSKFYWYELRHRRKFFENFAKEHAFDPLIPNNWYTLSKRDVKALKSNNVISHYSNSVAKALLALFPNIGLDESKFLFLSDSMQYISNSHLYFQDIQKRILFFHNYARVHNFNPTDPRNWYSQSFSDIWSFKGARNVLSHYSKSIPQALQDLFPNMDIESAKFTVKKDWSEVKQRKKLFESIAKAHSFDPLLAENWHKIPRHLILATPGSHAVMAYYNNSVIKALLELFPNIGINISKFSYVEDIVQERKFFEDFAARHKFDPLNAQKWYTRSRTNIWKTKGASKVLSNHNNDVIMALTNLFPEVTIDSSKFHNPHKGSMQNEDDRRSFFQNFAKEHGFDEDNPEHWYAQSLADIWNAKGARTVLSYHGNSVSKAIKDLFPNIQIDPSRFSGIKNRWQDVNNRREYFTAFARHHQFDPLSLQDWQSHAKSFVAMKDTTQLLAHYNGNLRKALIRLSIVVK